MLWLIKCAVVENRSFFWFDSLKKSTLINRKSLFSCYQRRQWFHLWSFSVFVVVLQIKMHSCWWNTNFRKRMSNVKIKFFAKLSIWFDFFLFLKHFFFVQPTKWLHFWRREFFDDLAGNSELLSVVFGDVGCSIIGGSTFSWNSFTTFPEMDRICWFLKLFIEIYTHTGHKCIYQNSQIN